MKYKLFAMKPTEENIIRMSKGYHRATAGYLLVYTAGRKPGKSVPVEVGQLSPGDLAWLEECNQRILEDTVNRDKDVQKKMLKFLDRLQVELDAEEKKLKEAGHG